MKNLVCLLFVSVLWVTAPAANTYMFEVKITGKGAPVIFIPGFACSGEVWNETKASFEKDHTCYTLTMAGFAGVPAQPNASFAAWEKSIADYIIEQKINQPVVIGHSMGGGLALALAADYPHLISKIVVVDALPCLAALSSRDFKSNPTNNCSATIEQYKAVPDSQFYQIQIQTMASLIADSSRREEAVQWSVRSDRATFAGMYCDFLNTDLREKIAAVKCPALILMEPSFAPFAATVNEQYKNLKTAQIHYANKGLHFLMFDDKEWYMQELNTFLKN